MPDDPYSIADLARLADVTPRTVRYYVAQGLLPSPDAAGPATRYGEGHLARLRLIKRLQRDHLPLAEIRARLERLGDEDVEAALAATDAGDPQPTMSTDETLAYVRDLMTRSGVAPRFYDRPAPPPARAMREVPDEFPMRDMPAPALAPAPASAPVPTWIPAAPPASTPRPQTVDRSTWERLSITPDIEIHVRRPLDRRSNKLVERLARIARDLFDDEP
ncbi:MAG TPA: MerR family transcriptional regulator [Candidatus Limnocylindrales bacterium]